METKNLILILFLTIAISLAITAHGKTNSKDVSKAKTKVARVATAKNSSQLSTDVRFDGQLVSGKIQSPFESLTVVENEKAIDDLIGMRTNFSDRIVKSQGMR